MQAITCTAKLQATSGTKDALITLPKSASDKLPSRGMTIVEGTINKQPFRVVLQPDGQASHWFGLSPTFCKTASISPGDEVKISMEPTKNWPEPRVPKPIQNALAADAAAAAQWQAITPMARWDWLNWMDSVKLEQTRNNRPAKLCSMLKAGKRRPCCFNRALQMTPKHAQAI